MKVAFHSNQLGYRGTEIAMYDYAYYNQSILGNESIIICTSDKSKLQTLEKFKTQFRVEHYSTPSEISNICEKNKVDVFYAIKGGWKDGILSESCKSVIHTVFPSQDIHGNVYAYVSEWLAKTSSNNSLPFVPHMVHRHTVDGDLKAELNIPTDAFVFGYYGGHDSFDIPFVHKEVYEQALRNKNMYFLFLGPIQFCPSLTNIIHLPFTADFDRKGKFINTCNAMLHARFRGETFGLSIAEFSAANKPVITYFGSGERNHIDILQDHAIYYSNSEHVRHIFENINNLIDPSVNYDLYTETFSPENVIKKFEKVFLQ